MWSVGSGFLCGPKARPAQGPELRTDPLSSVQFSFVVAQGPGARQATVNSMALTNERNSLVVVKQVNATTRRDEKVRRFLEAAALAKAPRK